MRVYIQTAQGRRFWIPVPYCILKFGTGSFAEKIIRKHVPAEQRVYVDSIDFSKLYKAVKVLKEYKGLNIVEVKAKDGTIVNVRL